MDNSDPQCSVDDDPPFNVVMENLADLLGARNEFYFQLSPVFSKIALEDPQCPIASWRGGMPQQFLVGNGFTGCKAEILSLLSFVRQALSWQWKKSHKDSSMLEITDVLARLSRSRECINAYSAAF